jgi:ankyrin repeat protein
MRHAGFLLFLVLAPILATTSHAQLRPSSTDIDGYRGVLAAAARDDTAAIASLAAGGARLDERDGHGRTPLLVAAHLGRHAAMQRLVQLGADANAVDADRYDAVTIAAVANDVATLKLALALGTRATNVTSRYDGTALIAAAHLGHVDVVRELIRAGAPLDHVNNLGWTALIESIVLGDGGPRHVATLQALIDAGANPNLADRQGTTPLALARGRGYAPMIAILQRAGAR